MASISSALASLAPAASFSVHGNEYENVNWQSDTPMPSKKDVLAEMARLQTIDNANAYKAKRKAEYPPVEEYLDGLVKGDQAQIDAYIAACQAVKDKYPKGTA